MGFLDPFAVDGATITAAQLRSHLFATVKGETGVLGPDSLKAVGIAGSPGLLGIMPGTGAVSVESRREAYQITNTAMDGDAVVEVPPAGSGGASWHVILEVTDPQYHGQPGDEAVELRLVSSLAGLTKPYLYVGSFDLPPGGGFDVTTPIMDRRRVILPRKERYLRAYQLFEEDSQSLHTTTSVWPNVATTTMYVPRWAREVHAVGHWATVRGTGRATGVCSIRFTDGVNELNTQNSRWQAPDSSESRFGITIGDDRAVPSWMRGQEVTVQMRATKTSGPNVYADGASSVVLDVEFLEVPV